MAKEKFNLGKLLAENVSDLNTLGRDQIEYIDLDKLNGDPDNFYSIEGTHRSLLHHCGAA